MGTYPGSVTLRLHDTATRELREFGFVSEFDLAQAEADAGRAPAAAVPAQAARSPEQPAVMTTTGD